jgi:hypothetical protein
MSRAAVDGRPSERTRNNTWIPILISRTGPHIPLSSFPSPFLWPPQRLIASYKRDTDGHTTRQRHSLTRTLDSSGGETIVKDGVKWCVVHGGWRSDTLN